MISRIISETKPCKKLQNIMLIVIYNTIFLSCCHSYHYPVTMATYERVFSVAMDDLIQSLRTLA